MQREKDWGMRRHSKCGGSEGCEWANSLQISDTDPVPGVVMGGFAAQYTH
jgi:hypothetical protein